MKFEVTGRFWNQSLHGFEERERELHERKGRMRFGFEFGL